MKKLLLAISGVLFFASCDTSPNLSNCDFDETGMLTNYADNIIIPRFSDLDVSLTLLHSQAQQFAATPTSGLLNEVRIYFGAAYGQYQECSMFAFGPGLISGVPFSQRFNTFPTNASQIETNVQNGAEVSASPNANVGFPALDYLLFGPEGSSDSDILALFTTDANAQNRLDYLVGLTSELSSTASSIITAWDASGANYRQTFINNTGTATGSSISLVVNDLNHDFETLKNFKFKIPLGKFNGGIVLPEQVEAYYAGGSAQLAKRQAEAFQKLYAGIGADQADGLGLDDYMDCLEAKSTTTGEALNPEILTQFSNIISAIDAIPDPMSETLVSNQQVVDNAHTQLQQMVPKIKYDLTTALGVQINYQDNDGD
ncbi:MAG: hypothetical protein GC178_12530 [Flavobacteriales bacterium]|nr:hypothetical protein [Flavobacteriales bacterium]